MKQQRAPVQIVLLTAALMVTASMFFCGTATAQDSPDQSEVKYDLLFISHGPDGEQVHVARRADGNRRTTVYKDRHVSNAIEWTIEHGRSTVILKGTYRITGEKGYFIRIKRDDRTLVVAPGAKLILDTERTGKPHPHPVIQVTQANNVRIFSFGVLAHAGMYGSSGVQFDGIRKGGQSGINGGLLFATGEVRNASGYEIIQTSNMNVPLLAAKHYGGNLFVCRGNHNQDVGTIAGLATGEQGGEGEAIDFNRYEKRTQVDRVIAPAPTVADEIVDVNHCQNLTIDHVQAFFGTERRGRLAVGYDLYGGPINGPTTRFSTRPHLDRNKRIQIKRIDRVQNELEGFSKNVSLPGFPEQLPTLQADVEILVHFEDGSKRTLLDKSYEFDL